MSGFDNDVVYAKNADFTQADNQAVSEANGLVTNGQMWIGTTSVNAGGTHVNVGTLTSPDGSVTFGYSSPNVTAVVAGGTTSLKTLTGNTGVATPSSGNINVVNANSTVVFTGSGSTLTQDFTGTNFALGSNMPSVTSGEGNLAVGPGVLNTITSGDFNVGIGQGALQAISSGNNNVSVGYFAGNAQTIGSLNTFIGFGVGPQSVAGNSNTLVGGGSFATFTGLGNGNTGLGTNVLANLQAGSNNCCLGPGSGNAYTGSESSNLLFDSVGSIGESNTIRIGTQGAASGQQNRCFIAGITGASITGAQAVGLSSAGQLAAPTIINNSSQPAFLATANVQNDVTGANVAYTVLYDNEIFDQNSDFTSPNFTAPVTGRYQFNFTTELFGLASANTGGAITIISSNRSVAYGGSNWGAIMSAATVARLSSSILIDMDAADTCFLQVQITGGTQVVDISATNTTFSGFLVC